MFFRSIGGSIGMATFGTVLNATIRTEIPARVDIAEEEAAGLIRIPEEIAKLPAAARQAVVDSVALGVSRIYWIGAGVMVVRRRRRRPAPRAPAAPARRAVRRDGGDGRRGSDDVTRQGRRPSPRGERAAAVARRASGRRPWRR